MGVRTLGREPMTARKSQVLQLSLETTQGFLFLPQVLRGGGERASIPKDYVHKCTLE